MIAVDKKINKAVLTYGKKAYSQCLPNMSLFRHPQSNRLYASVAKEIVNENPEKKLCLAVNIKLLAGVCWQRLMDQLEFQNCGEIGKLFTYLFCVHECFACMYVCVRCVPYVHGVQERASDALEIRVIDGYESP
ncbi:hypothetical protein STEG23_020084, partial [Scotinomys teguina]